MLPFLKFPAEIRRSVYQYYFNDLLLDSSWEGVSIIRKTPHDCVCASHKSHTMRQSRPLDMPIISTCSQIKEESLEEWFKHPVFCFACGCELSERTQS